MITFDDALPAIVNLVARDWGSEAISRNLLLRDAIGRITFVVLSNDVSGEQRQSLSDKINAALQGYADPSGISVATPDELFDEELKGAVGIEQPVDVEFFSGTVRVLDRRVVGSDWLKKPNSATVDIPRLFFVSLKGGVGRSTALCVLAAHLASHGRRVLALDLDLEAPGVGTMLLEQANLPRFGLLDYLVETNLSDVSDLFISDMIGASSLSGGRGTISVVPAFGQLATRNSSNVLAKLARAYLPSENDPLLSGFTAKIESLIGRITANGEYDVILVDARAGLHESTAAAAVALQGDTLIFGMDQPQTYAGYRALLAQQALTLGVDWKARLHLVEARVGAEGPSEEFLSNMYDLLPADIEEQGGSAIPLNELRETFDVLWDTETSATEPFMEDDVDSTYIYESDLFRRFDPLSNPDRLTTGLYGAVFNHFLHTCENIVQSVDRREIT